MMLGEPHRPPNPTIDVPPWPILDDPTDDAVPHSPYSPYTLNAGYGGGCDSSPSAAGPGHFQDVMAALRRFLPSNRPDTDPDPDMTSSREADFPMDVYSCDNFRMYEFKVRRCARGRSHDWTECPYAHPGEKARRRDPRKYHYSGTACPEFRKGSCRKGDACEFAHGVFECWLHPARYRTQPCKDGAGCRRRVCFFAHTPEQLRVVTPQQSPRGAATQLPFMASPSTVSPEDSPPMSPMSAAVTHQSLSRSLGSSSVNEMVMASLRNLQLGKVKSLPSSWNANAHVTTAAATSASYGSPLRPGFCSVPTTPTRVPARPGIGYRDFWDQVEEEEEPLMERVESGRDLRAKMFEKLREESSLDRADPEHPSLGGGGPNVEWVSDLVN
ncbi:hypothetical protein ACJRO7_016172 [Eucalyptus globulus]|uniref:C3H1-type domain-containing protein n=1 Tax=Eucalyptus globulus TaxID=34317 RepID=A0ABD3L731_EUCGL